MKNKKFKAMFFSIMPGAGHMYLNLPKQGIQLMSLFFLSIFISEWLNFGFFAVLAPIIWFYSFFDAGHKAGMEEPLEDGALEIFRGITASNFLSKDLNKIMGYGLIVLGFAALFEKILFPLLAELNFSDTFRNFMFEFRNYVHTGIIAAILIIVGIKLLSGSKLKSAE